MYGMTKYVRNIEQLRLWLRAGLKLCTGNQNKGTD